MAFTIPRKEKSPGSGLLEEQLISSRFFQHDLLPAIQNSYLNPQSAEKFFYFKVWTVQNENLEAKFQEKRQEMRRGGHSGQDLMESYAFFCVDTEQQAETVCREGLKIGNTAVSSLGQPLKGVQLCRHADVLRPTPLVDGVTYQLIVFKVLKGHAKVVHESQNPSSLEPSPGFDCHVAACSPSAGTPLRKIYTSTQVYLYEYSGEYLLESPHHLYPVAVVKFHYRNKKMSQKTVPEKTRGLQVPVSKITEQMNSDYVIWSGKLSVKGLFGCCVQILSPELLTLPVKLGSSINISCKVGIKEGRGKFLHGVTTLSRREETFCCGWFINVCQMRVSQPKSNFEKIRHYLTDKECMAVLKLEGDILLVMSDSEVTHQLGLTKHSYESNVHCLFLSKSSRKQKGSIQIQRQEPQISCEASTIQKGHQDYLISATSESSRRNLFAINANTKLDQQRLEFEQSRKEYNKPQLGQLREEDGESANRKHETNDRREKSASHQTSVMGDQLGFVKTDLGNDSIISQSPVLLESDSTLQAALGKMFGDVEIVESSKSPFPENYTELIVDQCHKNVPEVSLCLVDPGGDCLRGTETKEIDNKGINQGGEGPLHPSPEYSQTLARALSLSSQEVEMRSPEHDDLPPLIPWLPVNISEIAATPISQTAGSKHLVSHSFSSHQSTVSDHNNNSGSSNHNSHLFSEQQMFDDRSTTPPPFLYKEPVFGIDTSDGTQKSLSRPPSLETIYDKHSNSSQGNFDTSLRDISHSGHSVSKPSVGNALGSTFSANTPNLEPSSNDFQPEPMDVSFIKQEPQDDFFPDSGTPLSHPTITVASASLETTQSEWPRHFMDAFLEPKPNQSFNSSAPSSHNLLEDKDPMFTPEYKADHEDLISPSLPDLETLEEAILKPRLGSAPVIKKPFYGPTAMQADLLCLHLESDRCLSSEMDTDDHLHIKAEAEDVGGTLYGENQEEMKGLRNEPSSHLYRCSSVPDFIKRAEFKEEWYRKHPNLTLLLDDGFWPKPPRSSFLKLSVVRESFAEQANQKKIARKLGSLDRTNSVAELKDLIEKYGATKIEIPKISDDKRHKTREKAFTAKNSASELSKIIDYNNTGELIVDELMDSVGSSVEKDNLRKAGNSSTKCHPLNLKRTPMIVLDKLDMAGKKGCRVQGDGVKLNIILSPESKTNQPQEKPSKKETDIETQKEIQLMTKMLNSAVDRKEKRPKEDEDKLTNEDAVKDTPLKRQKEAEEMANMLNAGIEKRKERKENKAKKRTFSVKKREEIYHEPDGCLNKADISGNGQAFTSEVKERSRKHSESNSKHSSHHKKHKHDKDKKSKHSHRSRDKSSDYNHGQDKLSNLASKNDLKDREVNNNETSENVKDTCSEKFKGPPCETEDTIIPLSDHAANEKGNKDLDISCEHSDKKANKDHEEADSVKPSEILKETFFEKCHTVTQSEQTVEEKMKAIDKNCKTPAKETESNKTSKMQHKGKNVEDKFVSSFTRALDDIVSAKVEQIMSCNKKRKAEGHKTDTDSGERKPTIGSPKRKHSKTEPEKTETKEKKTKIKSSLLSRKQQAAGEVLSAMNMGVSRDEVSSLGRIPKKRPVPSAKKTKKDDLENEKERTKKPKTEIKEAMMVKSDLDYEIDMKGTSHRKKIDKITSDDKENSTCHNSKKDRKRHFSANSAIERGHIIADDEMILESDCDDCMENQKHLYKIDGETIDKLGESDSSLFTNVMETRPDIGTIPGLGGLESVNRSPAVETSTDMSKRQVIKAGSGFKCVLSGYDLVDWKDTDKVDIMECINAALHRVRHGRAPKKDVISVSIHKALHTTIDWIEKKTVSKSLNSKGAMTVLTVLDIKSSDIEASVLARIKEDANLDSNNKASSEKSLVPSTDEDKKLEDPSGMKKSDLVLSIPGKMEVVLDDSQSELDTSEQSISKAEGGDILDESTEIRDVISDASRAVLNVSFGTSLKQNLVDIHEMETDKLEAYDKLSDGYAAEESKAGPEKNSSVGIKSSPVKPRLNIGDSEADSSKSVVSSQVDSVLVVDVIVKDKQKDVNGKETVSVTVELEDDLASEQQHKKGISEERSRSQTPSGNKDTSESNEAATKTIETKEPKRHSRSRSGEWMVLSSEGLSVNISETPEDRVRSRSRSKSKPRDIDDQSETRGNRSRRSSEAESRHSREKSTPKESSSERSSRAGSEVKDQKLSDHKRRNSSGSKSSKEGTKEGTTHKEEKKSIAERLEKLASKSVPEAEKVDSRHSRQYHPYKKEEKKEKKSRKPKWSFDMAYRDMNELLENLTTHFFKQGNKVPAPIAKMTQTRRKTRRFAGYKFERSEIPKTPPRTRSPSPSDADFDQLGPEMIPDLAEREEKADQIENMFIQTSVASEDEEYSRELDVYIRDEDEEEGEKQTDEAEKEKKQCADKQESTLNSNGDKNNERFGRPVNEDKGPSSSKSNDSKLEKGTRKSVEGQTDKEVSVSKKSRPDSGTLKSLSALVIPGGPKTTLYSRTGLDGDCEESLELLGGPSSRLLTTDMTVTNSDKKEITKTGKGFYLGNGIKIGGSTAVISKAHTVTGLDNLVKTLPLSPCSPLVDTDKEELMLLAGRDASEECVFEKTEEIEVQLTDSGSPQAEATKEYKTVVKKFKERSLLLSGDSDSCFDWTDDDLSVDKVTEGTAVASTEELSDIGDEKKYLVIDSIGCSDSDSSDDIKQKSDESKKEGIAENVKSNVVSSEDNPAKNEKEMVDDSKGTSDYDLILNEKEETLLTFQDNSVNKQVLANDSAAVANDKIELMNLEVAAVYTEEKESSAEFGEINFFSADESSKYADISPSLGAEKEHISETSIITADKNNSESLPRPLELPGSVFVIDEASLKPEISPYMCNDDSVVYNPKSRKIPEEKKRENNSKSNEVLSVDTLSHHIVLDNEIRHESESKSEAVKSDTAVSSEKIDTSDKKEMDISTTASVHVIEKEYAQKQRLDDMEEERGTDSLSLTDVEETITVVEGEIAEVNENEQRELQNHDFKLEKSLVYLDDTISSCDENSDIRDGPGILYLDDEVTEMNGNTVKENIALEYLLMENNKEEEVICIPEVDTEVEIQECQSVIDIDAIVSDKMQESFSTQTKPLDLSTHEQVAKNKCDGDICRLVNEGVNIDEVVLAVYEEDESGNMKEIVGAVESGLDSPVPEENSEASSKKVIVEVESEQISAASVFTDNLLQKSFVTDVPSGACVSEANKETANPISLVPGSALQCNELFVNADHLSPSSCERSSESISFYPSVPSNLKLSMSFHKETTVLPQTVCTPKAVASTIGSTCKKPELHAHSTTQTYPSVGLPLDQSNVKLLDMSDSSLEIVLGSSDFDSDLSDETDILKQANKDIKEKCLKDQHLSERKNNRKDNLFDDPVLSGADLFHPQALVEKESNCSVLTSTEVITSSQGSNLAAVASSQGINMSSVAFTERNPSRTVAAVALPSVSSHSDDKTSDNKIEWVSSPSQTFSNSNSSIINHNGSPLFPSQLQSYLVPVSSPVLPYPRQGLLQTPYMMSPPGSVSSLGSDSLFGNARQTLPAALGSAYHTDFLPDVYQQPQGIYGNRAVTSLGSTIYDTTYWQNNHFQHQGSSPNLYCPTVLSQQNQQQPSSAGQLQPWMFSVRFSPDIRPSNQNTFSSFVQPESEPFLNVFHGSSMFDKVTSELDKGTLDLLSYGKNRRIPYLKELCAKTIENSNILKSKVANFIAREPLNEILVGEKSPTKRESSDLKKCKAGLQVATVQKESLMEAHQSPCQKTADAQVAPCQPDEHIDTASFGPRNSLEIKNNLTVMKELDTHTVSNSDVLETLLPRPVQQNCGTHTPYLLENSNQIKENEFQLPTVYQHRNIEFCKEKELVINSAVKRDDQLPKGLKKSDVIHSDSKQNVKFVNTEKCFSENEKIANVCPDLIAIKQTEKMSIDLESRHKSEDLQHCASSSLEVTVFQETPNSTNAQVYLNKSVSESEREHRMGHILPVHVNETNAENTTQTDHFENANMPVPVNLDKSNNANVSLGSMEDCDFISVSKERNDTNQRENCVENKTFTEEIDDFYRSIDPLLIKVDIKDCVKALERKRKELEDAAKSSATDLLEWPTPENSSLNQSVCRNHCFEPVYAVQTGNSPLTNEKNSNLEEITSAEISNAMDESVQQSSDPKYLSANSFKIDIRTELSKGNDENRRNKINLEPNNAQKCRIKDDNCSVDMTNCYIWNGEIIPFNKPVVPENDLIDKTEEKNRSSSGDKQMTENSNTKCYQMGRFNYNNRMSSEPTENNFQRDLDTQIDGNQAVSISCASLQSQIFTYTDTLVQVAEMSDSKKLMERKTELSIDLNKGEKSELLHSGFQKTVNTNKYKDKTKTSRCEKNESIAEKMQEFYEDMDGLLLKADIDDCLKALEIKRKQIEDAARSNAVEVIDLKPISETSIVDQNVPAASEAFISQSRKSKVNCHELPHSGVGKTVNANKENGKEKASSCEENKSIDEKMQEFYKNMDALLLKADIDECFKAIEVKRKQIEDAVKSNAVEVLEFKPISENSSVDQNILSESEASKSPDRKSMVDSDNNGENTKFVSGIVSYDDSDDEDENVTSPLSEQRMKTQDKKYGNEQTVTRDECGTNDVESEVEKNDVASEKDLGTNTDEVSDSGNYEAFSYDRINQFHSPISGIMFTDEEVEYSDSSSLTGKMNEQAVKSESAAQRSLSISLLSSAYVDGSSNDTNDAYSLKEDESEMGHCVLQNSLAALKGYANNDSGSSGSKSDSSVVEGSSESSSDESEITDIQKSSDKEQTDADHELSSGDELRDELLEKGLEMNNLPIEGNIAEHKEKCADDVNKYLKCRWIEEGIQSPDESETESVCNTPSGSPDTVKAMSDSDELYQLDATVSSKHVLHHKADRDVNVIGKKQGMMIHKKSKFDSSESNKTSDAGSVHSEVSDSVNKPDISFAESSVSNISNLSLAKLEERQRKLINKILMESDSNSSVKTGSGSESETSSGKVEAVVSKKLADIRSWIQKGEDTKQKTRVGAVKVKRKDRKLMQREILKRLYSDSSENERQDNLKLDSSKETPVIDLVSCDSGTTSSGELSDSASIKSTSSTRAIVQRSEADLKAVVVTIKNDHALSSKEKQRTSSPINPCTKERSESGNRQNEDKRKYFNREINQDHIRSVKTTMTHTHNVISSEPKCSLKSTNLTGVSSCYKDINSHIVQKSEHWKAHERHRSRSGSFSSHGDYNEKNIKDTLHRNDKKSGSLRHSPRNTRRESPLSHHTRTVLRERFGPVSRSSRRRSRSYSRSRSRSSSRDSHRRMSRSCTRSVSPINRLRLPRSRSPDNVGKSRSFDTKERLHSNDSRSSRSPESYSPDSFVARNRLNSNNSKEISKSSLYRKGSDSQRIKTRSESHNSRNSGHCSYKRHSRSRSRESGALSSSSSDWTNDERYTSKKYSDRCRQRYRSDASEKTSNINVIEDSRKKNMEYIIKWNNDDGHRQKARGYDRSSRRISPVSVSRAEARSLIDEMKSRNEKTSSSKKTKLGNATKTRKADLKKDKMSRQQMKQSVAYKDTGTTYGDLDLRRKLGHKQSLQGQADSNRKDGPQSGQGNFTETNHEQVTRKTSNLTRMPRESKPAVHREKIVILHSSILAYENLNDICELVKCLGQYSTRSCHWKALLHSRMICDLDEWRSVNLECCTLLRQLSDERADDHVELLPFHGCDEGEMTSIRCAEQILQERKNVQMAFLIGGESFDIEIRTPPAGPAVSTKNPVEQLQSLIGRGKSSKGLMYVCIGEHRGSKDKPFTEFTYSVTVDGVAYTGTGRSKREAKKEAAKSALIGRFKILAVTMTKRQNLTSSDPRVVSCTIKNFLELHLSSKHV